jgi:hypothetical protein
MKRTKMTGKTCVGELRLSSLDVGFDLRLRNLVICPPKYFKSVGLEEDGEVYLIEGTRDEMIGEMRKAGYRVEDDF